MNAWMERMENGIKECIEECRSQLELKLTTCIQKYWWQLPLSSHKLYWTQSKSHFKCFIFNFIPPSLNSKCCHKTNAFSHNINTRVFVAKHFSPQRWLTSLRETAWKWPFRKWSHSTSIIIQQEILQLIIFQLAFFFVSSFECHAGNVFQTMEQKIVQPALTIVFIVMKGFITLHRGLIEDFMGIDWYIRVQREPSQRPLMLTEWNGRIFHG